MIGRLTRELLALFGFAAILWGVWLVSQPLAWIVGGLGVTCGALIWHRATKGQRDEHR